MTGHIFKRLRDLQPFFHVGSFAVQGRYSVTWMTLSCGMKIAIDDPTADKDDVIDAYRIVPHDGMPHYLTVQSLDTPQDVWDEYMAYLRGDTDG